MSKTVKLIMITADNNNKYYNMSDNGNDTFTAEYGRIGSKAQRRTYPISKWDSVYKSKTKKGYIDNTELFIVDDENNNSIRFLDSRHKEVINIVNDLQKFANISIKNNYTVSSEQVTKKQIDCAQKLIDEIANYKLTKNNVDEFNSLLLKFYSTIPRKMKNVKDFLIDKFDDIKKNEIVKNEQDTLDVMSGQVQTKIKNKDKEDKKSKTDIISDLDLDLKFIDDIDIINEIKSYMDEYADKLDKVYEVTNFRTQKEFDKSINESKNKNIKLLFHGSRNENWWSILNSGLLIRPASAKYTGSMFGDGIYFASKFKKSYGYSSGRNSYWAGGNDNTAVLALYNVHIGDQKVLTSHDSSCYKLNEKNISPFDSVHAKSGKSLLNDEYIIYNSNKCTIKYLITLKV